MKIFVIIFIASFGILSLYANVVPPMYIDIDISKYEYDDIISTVNYAPFNCSGKYGRFCEEDCSTLLTCIGDVEPYLKQSCSEISPDRTYCIPNKQYCTTENDKTFPTCIDKPKTNFKCTSKGFFPDPSKCEKYHYCSGPDVFSVSDTCPFGYVFNSVNTNCKQNTLPNDCTTVNCNLIVNDYVVYTAQKSYYAFCLVKNSVKTIIMFKCEDVENFEYNIQNSVCEFICKKEGYYPHENIDNTCNYYGCYNTGFLNSELKVQERTCLPGTHFDRTQRKCIEGVCLTEATTVAPTTVVTPAPTAPTPAPTILRTPSVDSDSNFRCTSKGFFPDPHNCSKYHYCRSGGINSSSGICFNGYVYNASETVCKRLQVPSDCVTINCRNELANQFISYLGHKSYYALCSFKNNLWETIMFKCDGGNNFEYNNCTKQCEFKCKNDGNFATNDENNNCNYYGCYYLNKANDTLIFREETCLNGTKYNRWKRICVEGECTRS